VEFRALGEVCGYSKSRVDASRLNAQTFIGVDNLLPNTAGKKDASYTPNTKRLTSYRIGDVLLGNIRPYLKKIWLADNDGGCSGDVLAIRILEDSHKCIIPEFIYYLLSSDIFFAYDMQHAKGAKMPRGSKESILNYPIPILPLTIQKEIVKILDNFTQLEAELEAELTARKKQYEHYRVELLSFGDDVEFRALGEVCLSISAGGDLPKKYKKGQTMPSNEFPYPIYANATGMKGLYGFTDNYKIESNAITISARGAKIGYHTIREAKFTPIIRLITLVPNKDIVTTSFLNFALDMTPILGTKGGIPQLTVPTVKKIQIPIPSLSKQKEIVAILDNFDALVNDISTGLPAEISARKKQYEYYRNQLLTFKPLEAQDAN
jgi:type I restriction enzyme S subunit